MQNLKPHRYPPPTERQCRVVFSPWGATFFRDRNDEGKAENALMKLKHGRLTIYQAVGCDSPLIGCLQNRHIHAIHVMRERLRIELSDLCVDVFEGLPLAELTWIQKTMESELRSHEMRKRSALTEDPLPDRWRYVGPFHRPWQESKGFLLLSLLLLGMLGSVFSFEQMLRVLWAVDAGTFPISMAKIAVAGWGLTSLAMLMVSACMAISLYRWHEAGQAARSRG